VVKCGGRSTCSSAWPRGAPTNVGSMSLPCYARTRTEYPHSCTTHHRAEGRRSWPLASVCPRFDHYDSTRRRERFPGPSPHATIKPLNVSAHAAFVRPPTESKVCGDESPNCQLADGQDRGDKRPQPHDPHCAVHVLCQRRGIPRAVAHVVRPSSLMHTTAAWCRRTNVTRDSWAWSAESKGDRA